MTSFILRSPIALACLAGCMAIAGDAAPPTRANPLAAQLYERCVQEMVRSTCVALPGRSASIPAAREGAVFVAGVGAVDAAAYWDIRQAGEAMCGVVRRACERDTGSAPCRTAQALWRS
jgi:hypothetical protein